MIIPELNMMLHHNKREQYLRRIGSYRLQVDTIIVENFKKFMFRFQNMDPESESMIQNKKYIYKI